MPYLKEVRLFSPAKINLFLAVTGKRADGFHNIVSLIAILKFGDDLCLRIKPDGSGESLQADFKGLDLKENSILKAVRVFRKHHPFQGHAEFYLKKRIPIGGGLGGGSSNAVAALKALNFYFNKPLKSEFLCSLSLEIGSDCPLFMHEGLLEVRGRGEIITQSAIKATEFLKNQRVLLFKPNMSVDTVWAYEQLSSYNSCFLSENEAESSINAFNKESIEGGGSFFNSFSEILYNKCEKLRTLNRILKEDLNASFSISGSGSVCFLLLDKDVSSVSLMSKIKKVLGEKTFIVETCLA